MQHMRTCPVVAVDLEDMGPCTCTPFDVPGAAATDLAEWCRACPADAANEIERLREAARRAIKIIEPNYTHQREKVKDGLAILREALEPNN
jgi:hypothetical protein